MARWQPIASMVTTAPSIAIMSSSAGMATISLDFAATATCPNTSRCRAAKAETMWIGSLAFFLEPERREVLPSMATWSGPSGQVSRTQDVKAPENSAGSMRFIRMVSQRSPGTP